MRKTENWKSRIFENAERRYLRDVIQPALADLERTRARIEARMQKSRSSDQAMASLFSAEIERINEFEARLKKHAEGASQRFAARKTES